jgi:hypothetical protein
MQKNLISILCLVFLVMAFLPAQAFGKAACVSMHEAGIMPLWLNTQEIVANLEITNGAARMSGLVIGNVGTESITATVTLYRFNSNGSVSRIATFNNLRGTGSVWSWERIQHVARGYDYRLVLTAIVVRNGISETVFASITARAH